MLAKHLALVIAVSTFTGCPSRVPLKLDSVVLYRNGIGYFEHHGTIEGRHVALRFGAHELDDVLKTLTVIDVARGTRAKATTAVLPPQATGAAKAAGRQLPLQVVLGEEGKHELLVTYSVPTPVWKATYRVVLGEGQTSKALLQGWALINNASAQDWRDVRLTLATGAPMTFAMQLRTPRFVARPDISGKMVQPAVSGAVFSESAPMAVDRTKDTDHDRIPDYRDKCPTEPETYNGIDDDDGCPDRGRVVVQSASITILDKIYFAPNKATVDPRSLPIVDAIAATLRGNPQIRRVEIQGHAALSEQSAWALSAQRAGVVRAALQARGVKTELQARAYAATQPITREAGEPAQARNRRVEFLVTERHDGAASDQHGVITLPPRTTGHGGPKLVRVAGMARYALPGRVSIPRGSATMVTLVNRSIGGRDVALYRPDANVRGSDQHLQRAVLIENSSGLTLEPGPVAIFARGSFVGEGLLSRLHPAEVALIPYALDGATSMRRELRVDERPSTLVSVLDGVATVENISERVTRYEVQVGAAAPSTLVIKHPRQPGYKAVGLPPQVKETADAYLIELPVQPGKKSELVVRERRPSQRVVGLSSGQLGAKELALYARGSAFADDPQLARVIAAQRGFAAAQQKVDRLRERITDLGVRAGELRANYGTIAKARGPKAAALRKRLLARVAESSAALERLTTELTAASLELSTARDQLRKAIATLRIGSPSKAGR